QRFKPDVIWCLCLWDVSLAAALLGYLLGIPVVTSVCGSDFYGHKGKILSRIRMKITCELSQLVATTSVKFREDVGNALQIKEKKQMTKHWGIKDNIFNLSKRPTATQGIKKELHIDLGRILRDISFYKETLCALAKLKNSGVCFKATALMAGVQDYVVEDFKNIVQELDLSDSVAVWPVIRDEVGLAAYFGSCDIALNMIQRDQLGSSLLEALACGACLISTALPQYMELSSCGIQYLCVPIKPSADDIFKAITYARSSNLMSVAVQNKNFMLVRRHYSFESNTQTMFQAFRSVAGSKNLILKAL
ncbi:MAG: glycosyltransferase, partial [Verrucomicrobia bacterium]|nr:glycosyltransferase [Verrucomicrobiota bacterium]